MKLQDFFRNLSEKNVTWSVCLQWLWYYHGTQFLTSSFIPKLEKSFLKWRKITFLTITFGLLARLITFCLISVLSWRFRKIQKSKITIWQSWHYYPVIRHHFLLHCHGFYSNCCKVLEHGQNPLLLPPPSPPTSGLKRQIKAWSR